jgi:hypothetical protein
MTTKELIEDDTIYMVRCRVWDNLWYSVANITFREVRDKALRDIRDRVGRNVGRNVELYQYISAEDIYE